MKDEIGACTARRGAQLGCGTTLAWLGQGWHGRGVAVSEAVSMCLRPQSAALGISSGCALMARQAAGRAFFCCGGRARFFLLWRRGLTHSLVGLPWLRTPPSPGRVFFAVEAGRFFFFAPEAGRVFFFAVEAGRLFFFFAVEAGFGSP